MAITINGSGSITGISAGGLPDGSVTAADIESSLDLSGKTVTLPSGTGGKVLQVVQTVKNDTFSTASTSYVDVTGLSASITPSSTSSKILVLVNTAAGIGAINSVTMFNLLRGSTAIAQPSTVGTFAASRPQYDTGADQLDSVVIQYLDSPSTTSSTTYKIQMKVNNSTGYVNNRNSGDMQTISTIVLMEISA